MVCAGNDDFAGECARLRSNMEPAAAIAVLACLSACSAEDVTTFDLSDSLVSGSTLRQLVLYEQSEVSWPWFSHGIRISDERTQRWVVSWRLLESSPFLAHDHIEKGSWLEGDRMGDIMLANGTFLETFATVNEPDLLVAGLVEQAHCAEVEPRRVAYDRARSHFVTFCRQGLWVYRVGAPQPIEDLADHARLREFLASEMWHPGTRLTLSRDTRRLAIWLGREVPEQSAGRDPSQIHEVLVVALKTGKMKRVLQELPESVRTIDIEIEADGTVRTLLCSNRGAAGWKLAVSDTDSTFQPVSTPTDFVGCSIHDRVTWLPEHGLVLFVRQPDPDGPISINVTRYASGETGEIAWQLR